MLVLVNVRGPSPRSAARPGSRAHVQVVGRPGAGERDQPNAVDVEGAAYVAPEGGADQRRVQRQRSVDAVQEQPGEQLGLGGKQRRKERYVQADRLEVAVAERDAVLLRRRGDIVASGRLAADALAESDVGRCVPVVVPAAHQRIATGGVVEVDRDVVEADPPERRVRDHEVERVDVERLVVAGHARAGGARLIARAKRVEDLRQLDVKRDLRLANAVVRGERELGARVHRKPADHWQAFARVEREGRLREAVVRIDAAAPWLTGVLDRRL